MLPGAGSERFRAVFSILHFPTGKQGLSNHSLRRAMRRWHSNRSCKRMREQFRLLVFFCGLPLGHRANRVAKTYFVEQRVVIHSTNGEVTIALLEDKQLVERNNDKKISRSRSVTFTWDVKKLIPRFECGIRRRKVTKKDAFLHYLDLGPPGPAVAETGTPGHRREEPDPLLTNLQMEPDIDKGGRSPTCSRPTNGYWSRSPREPISTKGPPSRPRSPSPAAICRWCWARRRFHFPKIKSSENVAS